jgi:hypothetical protein
MKRQAFLVEVLPELTGRAAAGAGAAALDEFCPSPPGSNVRG